MKKSLREVEISRIKNVNMAGNKDYDAYDKAMMCICRDMDEYINSRIKDASNDDKELLLKVKVMNFNLFSYVNNLRETKEKEALYFAHEPVEIMNFMEKDTLSNDIRGEVIDYISCFNEYYTMRRNAEKVTTKR